MKKKLLNLMAGSFVLICSVSIAQPTLTATGINPVLGDNLTYFNGNYVGPGPSGANQTWNLSTISGTSGGLTTIVTPASTTNGSSFTTSSVAAENTSSGTNNYYKTSAIALQNSGIDAGGIVITYSDFEDYLRFPVSYTNSFTDTWAATFFSGTQFWRTGNTTATADSYGTLITPNGTYTNVMRVHFVQIYQDSAYFGTPFITTYNNDQYFWYKEGVHLPIAGVYTLTSSSGGPYTGGFYNSTVVVGINEVSNHITSSNVFPNPAVDLITINFELTENKKVTIQLFNSLGQEMEINQSTNGSKGLNSIQLNIATLPEGIYFAQLLLEGNTAVTKQFVVKK
jgi:hypothetical protein